MTSSNTVIGPSSTVTLHFSLTINGDEIVDSNFDRAPASFNVGDGKLLPGFEQALFGLKAGDKATLIIPPEQGFGQTNPNNVQCLERSGFSADMALSKGLMISFGDASGAERPGVVSEFNDEHVYIDFNHPLAGRDITFKVEIIGVEQSLNSASSKAH